MRNATNARIGNGKAVHFYYEWCARTDCATGGMGDADAKPTEDAVTCKRCLKALAVQVERDHAKALDMDAARPVSSNQNTETPKETQMRKLSNAQAVALMNVRVHNDLKGVKPATVTVLLENGLIEPVGPNRDMEVTEAGEREYTRATGDTLPPKNVPTPEIESDEVVAARQESLKADHTEALIVADLRHEADPAVALVDEIEADRAANPHLYDEEGRKLPDSLIVKVPEGAAKEYDVRKPVALDTSGRRNIKHWLRPAEEVQALRDQLIEVTTPEHADVILDTWHLVENRSDRRASAKADRAKSRQMAMRHTRRPSRRRFTSEAAKIRKAERRAASLAERTGLTASF